MPLISIVMPVFNEEKYIRVVFRLIKKKKDKIIILLLNQQQFG
jgi:glycosyltransferase involved in cell wall biosynthesis